MYDKDLQNFIVISADFLLEHNYFIFNQTYFFQCRGEIGASGGGGVSHFLPSLANLYMGWWEEDFFSLALTPVQAPLNGMAGTLMT